MANFMFNAGKGRVTELFARVDGNEPSASTIVLVPVKVSDTAANRQDDATLEAVLASAIDEQTEGWSRKALDDTLLAPANYAPDNAADRGIASIPAVKWTTPTSGKNTTGVLICYSPSGGADSTIIPLMHLDMAVTADGNDVEINAGKVFEAA